MVKREAATEFWVRHDRQKSPMSIMEIRNAIVAIEEMEVKVERFIEQRQQELAAESDMLHLTLTGTPLTLESGRIDTRDERLIELLRQPPSYRTSGYGPLSDTGARIWPTLHGVEALGGERQNLRVFRSGHVEFIMKDRSILAYEQQTNGETKCSRSFVRTSSWSLCETSCTSSRRSVVSPVSRNRNSSRLRCGIAMTSGWRTASSELRSKPSALG